MESVRFCILTFNIHSWEITQAESKGEQQFLHATLKNYQNNLKEMKVMESKINGITFIICTREITQYRSK